MMLIRNVLVAAFAVAASVHAESILFSCSNPPAAYFGLYTMRDDGSNVRPVVTSMYAWAPGIADNGLDVAFVNPALPASNLYLTTVYGAPPTLLAITNKALTARFVGTNDLLFLARESGGGLTRFSLWRVGRDGAGERRVSTDSFDVWPVGAESFDVDQSSNCAYVCGDNGSQMTLWRVDLIFRRGNGFWHHHELLWRPLFSRAVAG